MCSSLIAVVIVFLVVSVSRRLGLAESELNKTLVVIMGNMVALPQVIIFYAMLDIFLYNIYAKALPALWAFGLLVLFAGAIIIAVVFFRAFARSRNIKTENTSGSETNGREETTSKVTMEKMVSLCNGAALSSPAARSTAAFPAAGTTGRSASS